MELSREDIILIFQALANETEVTGNEKYINVALKMLTIAKKKENFEKRKIKF